MPLSRRKFITNGFYAFALLATARAQVRAQTAEKMGLSEIFKNDFLVGSAINDRTLKKKRGKVHSLVRREFNSVVAENAMKWEKIHPRPGKWRWKLADRLVAMGEKSGMSVHGHVLVWHSQTPSRIFVSRRGKLVDKNTLLETMEEHILTVVGRYKGRIASWDVVNEAVDDNQQWRNSRWFNIIGPEFIEHAFRFAKQADPNAQLVYNDYNMYDPGKRDFVSNFVQHYKNQGVPIHGIGMQMHVGIKEPSIDQIEASLKAFAGTGSRLHISELDVDVLPAAWDHIGAEISRRFKYSDELNPYPDGLPKSIERRLTKRYETLFALFLKYREAIDRVTFWGVGDKTSWKNNFPVKGRTNYPLLFDRKLKPKDAYHAISALRQQISD